MWIAFTPDAETLYFWAQLAMENLKITMNSPTCTNFINDTRQLNLRTRKCENENVRVCMAIKKELKTKEKIGAKVFSARIAKTFNLFTTALTRCLCNAREHVAKSGEIRWKTTTRQQLRFTVAILTSNKI